MKTGSDNYYSYWGKAQREGEPEKGAGYHLLVYHCLDVAAVGQKLLEQDPLLMHRFTALTGFNDDQVLHLIPFLLALHDLGKFSDRFQNLKPDLMELLQGNRGSRRYPIRHDSMALYLFEQDIRDLAWKKNWFWMDHDLPYAEDEWFEIFAPLFRAVSGHHGEPPQHDETVSVDSLFLDGDRAAARDFAVQAATLLLGSGSYPPIEYSEGWFEQFSTASWLLAGLVTLSDWLGSNRTFFPFQTEAMDLAVYWKNFAQKGAEDAVRDAGVLPATVSSNCGMAGLFPPDLPPKITSPSPIQTYLSSCSLTPEPRLTIIEETTGGGKTEAALVLAHRLMNYGCGEGIFMGLPTMATADSLYGRIAQTYQRMYTGDQRASVVLATSARDLSDLFKKSVLPPGQWSHEQYKPGEETASATCTIWLAQNRKKALLAQVGVGTIDQALMAVLPFRHQSLRLLGLARNILIVDEVHAYDPYMHTVLCGLLKFQAAFGGSAILLSATLTMAQRQDLTSAFCAGLGRRAKTLTDETYPLITMATAQDVTETPIDSSAARVRTVRVQMVDDSADVLEQIVRAAGDGRCVCWVRNTIDDAINAFNELNTRLESRQVLLFHARFALGDRLDIEKKVLDTFGKESLDPIRRGMVLVATQVVEQSLDLDFDLMITDLAPMDLIIQRAGRLHRHPRGDRGEAVMVVLAPPLTRTPDPDWYKRVFPKGGYVYPNHGQLWLTAQLLDTKGKIVMPDGARDLIEGVFGDGAQIRIPLSLLPREVLVDGKKRGDISIARLNTLEVSDGYRRTPTQWVEEAHVSTRLGQLTSTLVLARWDGTTLTPWYSSNQNAWDLSQVHIAEKKVASAAVFEGELGAAVKRLEDQIPGLGKWLILVPLSCTSAGTWEGPARNDADENVTVIYDPVLGFMMKN
ncbi:CRISPR-associated helicase/endonuclease Cas3 [Methanosphaerula palustris]|uniref:CRISPR-associated helicase Cas3 n=1 Tax=Methanosphaerula palustris (strain ATCC BAA-1556 / DSM 19958 / E1-9c) TaxID=521011 RepID=B8GIV7_METPE|nr:CRISPR-associated helicase/endonuclease Cas3 [Methanosphaerula palustris]ACL16920.1 CRISPR-associated helicase Cas3 [Methanosphaerula palustris E1-9c]